MRVMTAAIVVLAALLVGYSGAGLSAQVDGAPAGVRVGDVLQVTYPSAISGAMFTCTVAAWRDGFVRCREEESRTALRPGPVTWHNLRLAWQVTVMPRDEFALR